jgi:two-component system phosphate regulon response regulator PhoB
MKKILIVDDSKEIRMLVKATLENNDYKVFEASNGEKAVELAEKYKPDIIIMDLMMPGLDGIEATRQIKSSSITNRCPIIILTGSESLKYAEALKAGATDVFIKPFSPLDLITKVDQILEVPI